MTRYLDHPLVTERYFFPRPDRLPQTFWIESPGGRLACYYRAPHRGARTIVHFHGNGEVVADYVPELAQEFAAMGVNVLFVEYRGYGESTGKPQLVAMLDDVDAVFDALGQPAENLIALGRSVGSIYALELVHRHPGIWGLVLESGIADVLQRVALRVAPHELGTTDAVLAREAATYFDHRAKLGAYRGRLLVLHAQDDGLMPLWHAQQNHASATRAKRRIVIFPTGGHNAIFAHNRRRYLEEVARFLSGADQAPDGD